MTLTNTDSSQVSLKQKQKVLYGWKANNDALVIRGLSVLREQPTFQSLSVITMRNFGGCKCSQDALANPYEFNGLSQCGCGTGQ